MKDRETQARTSEEAGKRRRPRELLKGSWWKETESDEERTERDRELVRKRLSQAWTS